MKSYCKIISVSFYGESQIDFRDTNGGLIDCNYFSVDCRSESGAGGDKGFFIAQPSGIYDGTASSIAYIESVSAAGHHTSAGMGGVVGTADGSVEMSLNSNQKTAGIRLWNFLDDTEAAGRGSGEATFVVTYGNIKQANPKRDQDDAFYPAGG